MYYFSKDWSSRYLLCLTVSLMNFLVKGFILNDVNNSFNFLVPVKSLKPAFPSASNHSGFPSFTMARCERQHPANCCFLQAVNLSQFFFFSRKIAWRNWQLRMEHLYYINNSPFRFALFTGQNMTLMLTGSTKYEKWNQTAFFSCLIDYHPQEF